MSGPFEASPLAFVSPSDEDSLVRLIRWARREAVPLVPRGAGTGMPGGNLGPYVVVEIGDHFARIEPLEDGRRLCVGAGAVAHVADAIAAEHGRFLPFLPSSSRWCRVGGMIGTNAAGPRSFRYGATCQWIEALEGVDASGRRFRIEGSDPGGEPFVTLRSGLMATLADHPSFDELSRPLPDWPDVRKNSSGYALDRFLPSGAAAQLLVGSEGTLAFITAAEIRTEPLPQARAVCLIPVFSPEELTAVAGEALRHGATACEFFGRRFLEMAALETEVGRLADSAFSLVLLELSGSLPEVEDALEALSDLTARHPGTLITHDPEAMARLWAVRHAASPTIARQASHGRFSTQFVEDSVVPPHALGAYLIGLDDILTRAELDAVVFGHAGDANVHVNPLLDLADPAWRDRAREVLVAVSQLVRRLGGTLSGEHGDGRIRAPFLSTIWSETLSQAFSTVKQTCDPEGILNPGVVVPLPGQDPFEGFRPRPRAFP